MTLWLLALAVLAVGVALWAGREALRLPEGDEE